MPEERGRISKQRCEEELLSVVGSVLGAGLLVFIVAGVLVGPHSILPLAGDTLKIVLAVIAVFAIFSAFLTAIVAIAYIVLYIAYQVKTFLIWLNRLCADFQTSVKEVQSAREEKLFSCGKLEATLLILIPSWRGKEILMGDLIEVYPNRWEGSIQQKTDYLLLLLSHLRKIPVAVIRRIFSRSRRQSA